MENLTKMIVEKQPFKGLNVISAKFDKALIFEMSGAVNSKPIIQVELEVEGRKHPVRKDVIYGFCPFCGVEYHPSVDKGKGATNEG
jgi:hypothetical protein